MRLIFKELTLHNFGSYTDTTVQLQGKGFCLVSGTNKCIQDNAKSNGAGKSFLWSGICYALTGATIQGLKTNLKNIHVADKDMYVKLTMLVNADEYIIERGQNGTAKSLKIIKNAIDISGKTFTESVDKLAVELADLSQGLISSIIILGQGMPNKFSSYSPAGRKELLEKLTKSDFMIEDIKERVDSRSIELQKQLRIEQDSLLVHQTNLNTYTNALKSATDELTHKVKPDFDTELNVLTTTLAKLELDSANTTAAITQQEKLVEDTNARLLIINTEKNQQIVELEKSFNEAISNLAINKNTLLTNIKNLTNEITKLKSIVDICPTCGQKLVNVQKPDTTAQEAELADLKTQLYACEQALTVCDAKRLTYLAEIDKTFEASINTVKTDSANAKKTLSTLKTTLATINTEIFSNTNLKSKLLVEKENWDKSIANLQNTITANEQNVAQTANMIALINTAIADINEHLAVINKINTLIKRDFRGYLLTNIITYLNNKAKDYCDIVFGTRNIELTVDGNALNITYCDKLLDNLSGGEKQRIDLILQFTIRNMLESYLDVTSNIIVLDEITDFLDKVSCDAVMNLIERELKSTESVFIVSHHVDELDLPIDSEIRIEKDKIGNSRIV